jgi:hypothetical protein
MGCSTIVAECGSSETVQACTGETMWWNEASPIYANIVDVTTMIENVTFNLCPREAYKVAYDLAKFSF